MFALTLLLTLTTTLLPATAQANGQWGLPEGAKLRIGKGRITEIEFSPDGQLLAVATGIGIWLYDVPAFREVALLTGHTNPVISADFSADGQTLASASDDTIRIWDVTTGTLRKTFTSQGEYVNMAIGADGKILSYEVYMLECLKLQKKRYTDMPYIGKPYVGMSKNPEKRMQDHLYDSRSPMIKDARKFGRGSNVWRLSILASYPDFDTALHHENLFIEELDAFSPHGYNGGINARKRKEANDWLLNKKFPNSNQYSDGYIANQTGFSKSFINVRHRALAAELGADYRPDARISERLGKPRAEDAAKHRTCFPKPDTQLRRARGVLCELIEEGNPSFETELVARILLEKLDDDLAALE